MPTRSISPKPSSQLKRYSQPLELTGNDAVPNSLPTSSSTAATWTSRCVSTPPVTWRVASTMVMSSLFLKR